MNLCKTRCFNSELPGSREEGMCEMKLWCQPRDFAELALFPSVGVHLGGATLTMLRSFCLQLMSLIWILLAHHQLVQGESVDMSPSLSYPSFQTCPWLKSPQFSMQNRDGLTWKSRKCCPVINDLRCDTGSTLETLSHRGGSA